MATRILFQDIYTKDYPLYADGAVDAGHMAVARKVARPDTTIVHRYVPKTTFFTDMFWPEMLNSAQIVHEIVKGENEGGFDAAIIGCGNDPGLEAAREAVSMPVVGILETGMLVACMLGARFACLLTDARCVPLVERKIKLYGMEARAIHRPARVLTDCGIESFNAYFSKTGGAYDRLVASVNRTAKEAIADGAEVMVSACGALTALTLHGYLKVEGTECPICEGFGLGIKMAEYLADIKKVLGVSTSRVLTYSLSPWCPKEAYSQVTEAFFQS